MAAVGLAMAEGPGRPPKDLETISDDDDGHGGVARGGSGAPLGRSAGCCAPRIGVELNTSYTLRLLRNCSCDRACHVWCRANAARCWKHRRAWSEKAKGDQDRDLFRHLLLDSAPTASEPRPRLAPPSPTSGRSRDTKSLVTRCVSRLSRGSGGLARRGSGRCARVSARARAGPIWMDGTARAGPIWMDALSGPIWMDALFGA